jgi:hypothetical protein
MPGGYLKRRNPTEYCGHRKIQLVALQGGVGCGMEMPRRARASADAVKPESADNLIGGEVLFFHDGLDAVPDKGELISKQPWLHLADQLMDSEQGMQLGDSEPEAG